MRLFISGTLLGAALMCAQQPQPQAQPRPQQEQPQKQSAVLDTPQANELMTRSLQLMEAAGVALPDMNRAGAPIIENARQAAANLRIRGGNLSLTYTYLTNLRAYMYLADAVNKPFPFPQESARQLAELRDSVSRFESHFRGLLEQGDHQLGSPDRDDLKRYSEANQLIGPPGPSRHRIVFLGDSITEDWRLNEYFPDREFVNRGISGQVTGEMLGRFKADVVDLKPEAVLILAGTNDIARGVNLTAIENYYTMMGDLADKYRIKVIWASILPVSDYHKSQNPAWEMTRIRPPAYIKTLNTWLQNFCTQRGYVYLDYYSSMVDTSGMLQADLADDGLHPNSAGYRIMAPLAQGAIQRALGRTEQPKSLRKRLFGKSS